MTSAKNNPATLNFFFIHAFLRDTLMLSSFVKMRSEVPSRTSSESSSLLADTLRKATE